MGGDVWYSGHHCLGPRHPALEGLVGILASQLPFQFPVSAHLGRGQVVAQVFVSLLPTSEIPVQIGVPAPGCPGNWRSESAVEICLFLLFK